MLKPIHFNSKLIMMTRYDKMKSIKFECEQTTFEP